MIEDCTALILAGGNSRRMGQDKAMLVLDGVTLLECISVTMRKVFPEVLISVRQPREDMVLAQVCDTHASGGPLAGLAAGLSRIKTPWVFAVACDMPFITPAVVENLATFRDKHEAVVPVVSNFPQPLAAYYATSALEKIEAALDSNDNSLRGMLGQLDVRYVSEVELRKCDSQFRSFIDLDTPQEYQAALK